MFSTIKKLFTPKKIDTTQLFSTIKSNIQLNAEPTEPKTFPSFNDFLREMYIDQPHGMIKFKTYPFQFDLANTVDNNKNTFVLHSRQMGITTMAMFYAFYSASIMDNQRVLLIGNSFNHATAIRDRLVRSVDHLSLIRSTNKAHIELYNGSTITFQGMREDTWKGVRAFYNNDSFDAIVIDNANYVPHRYVEELMQFLSLTFTTKIFVASSAGRSTKDLLHRLMSSRIEGARIVLPWNTHSDRDERWAEPYKEQLGQKNFAQEYECQIVTEEKEA